MKHFKNDLAKFCKKWYLLNTMAEVSAKEIERDSWLLTAQSFYGKYSVSIQDWRDSNCKVAFNLPLSEFTDIVDFEPDYDDFDPVTYIYWHLKHSLNSFNEIVDVLYAAEPCYDLGEDYVWWNADSIISLDDLL